MKNHTKTPSMKSLNVPNKIPKATSNQNMLYNNSISNKAKLYQLKKSVNNAKNMSTFDYYTDISSKRAEPSSSYRSKQESKDIIIYRKNIDFTAEKDLSSGLVLKKTINNKEKRFNSLKKPIHNSKNINDSVKYIRASSIISNIEANDYSDNDCNSKENSKQNNNSNSNHNNNYNDHNNNGNGNGHSNSHNVNYNKSNKPNRYNKELENENAALKQTINILVNYIRTLNKQLDDCVNNQIKAKNDEINLLKAKNTFLINLTQKLTMKLLECSYAAKLYDLNETNRTTNAIKLMTQLYKENEFLRASNVNAILNQTLSYKDYATISHNNQSESPNRLKDNIINTSNTPRINDCILNSKHKRQATHINLTFAETEGDAIVSSFPDANANNQTIIPYDNNTNTQTIQLSKPNEDDVLSSTIQTINETVKSRIRRNNSCKEIKNSEDETNTFPSTNSSFINDINMANANNKKPLCYNNRSLVNKEKKLIEFTK